MSYTIQQANTSLPSDERQVIIPDNVTDTTYYDSVNQVGIQFLGNNTINYAAAIAQNTLQMVSNFAGPALPNPSWTQQGQLFFNTTNQTMYVKFQYTGSPESANWVSLASISPTGNSNIPGNLTVGGGVTVTGNVNATNAIFTGSVSAASAVISGTIIANAVGSSGQPVADIYATSIFGGTFYGVATSADYSDLAERYAADKPMKPGTVVALGGTAEITRTTKQGDKNVFGVVSTSPGFMLNAKAGDNETHPYIALSGRVPVYVTGKVKKGWRLVASDTAGVAEGVNPDDLHLYTSVQIIGRALEDKIVDKLGQITAVVGVK